MILPVRAPEVRRSVRRGRAEGCADFQRAAERRLMVTPLSAWEGRKRRFAYLSDFEVMQRI